MNKRFRKVMALIMAMVMMLTVSPAFAAGDEPNIYRNDNEYLIQKVSNPAAGEGEVDGLETGGDRQNSYAWSMAELADEYGNYIYIGSNRNVIYSGKMFLPMEREVLDAMIDLATNGEIYTGSTNLDLAQAAIMRYNVDTGEMETYFDSADHGYSSPYGLISGFRAALSFKGELYFNAKGGNSYIYRISSNNQDLPEVVFESDIGGFMRAMALSEDGETMYIGGTGTTSMMEEAETKADYSIVVYKTADGENYEMIADEADFLPYEKAEYRTSGGDVWDMVEYNGILYFTLMTLKGGIVYKAHEDPTDSRANKYGWVWEEFVGENGEIGAGFGNPLNYALTPYIFNKDLYFIGFTNAMDALVYAGNGLFEYLNAEYQDKDLNALFSSFRKMDECMENETAIFRITQDGRVQMVMGDESDCPDNVEFAATLGAGFNDASRSTTLYNWRAAIYDGKFYIGTFDAHALYKYFTKLTNGNLFKMSDEEYRRQLEYLIEFLKLVRDQDNFDNSVKAMMFSEEELLNEVEEVQEVVTPETEEMEESLDSGSEKRSETKQTPEDQINQAAKVFGSLVNLENLENISPEDLENLQNILPENLKSLQDISLKSLDDLIDLLVFIHHNIDGEEATEFVSKILHNLSDNLKTLEDLENTLESLINLLKDLEADPKIIDSLEFILHTMQFIRGIFGNLSSENLECYLRVSDTIAANDNPGFELYCTEDGINYTPVILDGCADSYNYGARTLLTASDGLYLGTANPFYGAQLWKINEVSLDSSLESNISTLDRQFKADVTDYKVTVSNERNTFEFTLTPGDEGNKVYLNDKLLKDNSGSVALETGDNTVKITNEAVNGDRVDYSILINRKIKHESSGHSSGGSSDGDSDVRSYTLNFDTNGGLEIASVSKNAGSSVDLSKYTAERNGYKFTGWYADKDCTKKLSKVVLDSNKTVYAGWEEDESGSDRRESTGGSDSTAGSQSTNNFADVLTSDWFCDAVNYVYSHNLMKGTAPHQFSPYLFTNRAMLVSILWNLEGCPVVNYALQFNDVPADAWYTEPIRWAAGTKIVKGYSNQEFGPNDTITTEQMFTILCNYAQKKGYDVSAASDLTQFLDAGKISNYALNSIKWAKAAGLIVSDHSSFLYPDQGVKRCEIAASLQKLVQNVVEHNPAEQ